MTTIIIPTGRMQEECINLLDKMKIKISNFDNRKYMFEDDNSKYRFLFVKPADIPMTINSGIGDVGIVGLDILLEENNQNLEEVNRLNIGACQMIIAAKAENTFSSITDLNGKVIATKYVTFTKKFLKDNNIKPKNIIKMNGSVEIAPLIGLADYIVDIKQSGETLKANGLIDFYKICDISATTIINKKNKKIIKDENFKNLINALNSIESNI